MSNEAEIVVASNSKLKTVEHVPVWRSLCVRQMTSPFVVMCVNVAVVLYSPKGDDWMI